MVAVSAVQNVVDIFVWPSEGCSGSRNGRPLFAMAYGTTIMGDPWGGSFRACLVKMRSRIESVFLATW